MSSYRFALGNILDNIDRAEALVELNPRKQGHYVHLNCPLCGQNTAYISQSGYYIYCNRKNKCGYVSGLVEYMSNRDNTDESEVISNLAKIANVELPELTSDDLKRQLNQTQKDSLLKDIMKISKYGIWLKQAAKVRSYLYNRSYNDSDILLMNFGYLPPILELKKKLLESSHSPILIDNILGAFDSSHPLLIPIFDPTGKIDGFAARTIDNSINPKYLYSKGLERGSYFFNLSESKASDKLIIVEGLIDALVLKQRGIEGVIACGGDSPTERQISSIAKYINRPVVLCLDTDTAGINGTRKSINLLLKNNFKVFIADTKPFKDPDEFIKNRSIEEFKEVVDNALNWAKWKANDIISNNELSNDIGREITLERLLDLYNSISDPIDSNYVLNIIINELGFDSNVINEKILSLKEKLLIEKNAKSYQNMLKEAFSFLKQGRYDKIDKTIETSLNSIRSNSSLEYIVPYSIIDATKDIQSRQIGLNTGYPSIDDYVSIPNGAVTLVAGRPSHGKTTFLLNMFLNVIDSNPDKSFFFFSYEESKTALFVKIINILSQTIINEKLKYKNSLEIEYYIKGGIKDHSPTFKSGLNNPFYTINQSILKYEQYVKSNRIWLIDTPLDIQTLNGIIPNLTNKYNVGGIFIDYAQRIKYNGSYDSERIKIARVSEILREAATKYDLPLIVGAQLNRENAKSKPQLDNLKEAGNLEEDANVVLGLYNWKTAIDKEKADMEYSKKNCKGNMVSTEDRSIDFEVHILKNRNGVINESALLTLDAPILKIKESQSSTNSPF